MVARRHLPPLLAFLAVSACAAPAPAPEAAPPVNLAALKDAIQAREKEWSAAYLSANAVAVAALYTEDGASVQAAGDWQRGRSAVAQGIQLQLDSTTYTAREDITEEVIPAGPDHIFEIGHFSSTGTAKVGGKARTSSGRYMVLWRKDADGVWRIHRDMSTEAPAKP